MFVLQVINNSCGTLAAMNAVGSRMDCVWCGASSLMAKVMNIPTQPSKYEGESIELGVSCRRNHRGHRS